MNIFNIFETLVCWDVIKGFIELGGLFCLGIVAKGGKSGEQQQATSISQGFAPMQIGAEIGAGKFRPKFWDQMIGGYYNMAKSYMLEMTTPDMQEYLKKQKHDVKYIDEKVSGYQGKIENIVDQMMMTLTQGLKKDEILSFPMDKLIDENLKYLTANAKDIYEGKLDLTTVDIKRIVDANANTLFQGYRQQRRGIEQALARKGVDPASAQGKAELDRVQRALTAGREDVARQILGQELMARPERRMKGLSILGATTGQMSDVAQQRADRYFTQMSQKLAGFGQAAQMYSGLIGSEFQKGGWKMGQLAFPMEALKSYGYPLISELGRQAISEYGTHVQAYTGAQEAESQSSGTQWAWDLGLSDIRVKENIKVVGYMTTTIPIYSYKFLWSNETHIGPMAQDVEKVFPHAVIEIAGLKYINYATLNKEII